jgi:hypothetical protein
MELSKQVEGAAIKALNAAQKAYDEYRGAGNKIEDRRGQLAALEAATEQSFPVFREALTEKVQVSVLDELAVKGLYRKAVQEILPDAGPAKQARTLSKVVKPFIAKKR